MVWLDFEEHVDLYRMRDKMFMERSGMFNSADFGLTLTGGFGEDLPDEYKEEVNDHYTARNGSFAVGVYNGTGYHGNEQNEDKTVQGRITVRPLPEVIPGFQLSGLAIIGEGNQEGEPDEIPNWKAYNAMASYQFPRGTLTAQYSWGEGNQKGSWTEPGDPSEATDYEGYSLFGEYKIGPHWRLIGGYDDLDRTPGTSDLSFTRWHGGIGYDFGGRNILLFDLDRRNWDDSDLETDTRFQTVMQVKF
jgi:predicted porin